MRDRSPVSSYPRFDPASIITRLEILSVSSNREEREGNGNFGLKVEIKGRTKPREREKGTMAKLQHVVTEAWTASPSYVKVQHLRSLDSPRVSRFVTLSSKLDPLPFSDRERLVCMYIYISRDECERVEEGVTQRGSYVTHHLRRRIIGKKFALRFLEFEKVWKREREKEEYFFLFFRSESSARARDRAILKKERRRWDEIRIEKKIFVWINIWSAKLWNCVYRHYSLFSFYSLVFLGVVRVIGRNHVGREPTCRWKKGEEC